MQVNKLGELLNAKKMKIVTAESCTAGGVGAAIASVDGASCYFVGGVICYATELKESLLGVEHDIIARYGVVSKQTVLTMNEGVRKLTHADVAISTTGYVGTSGGDEFASNGTVWICVSANNCEPYTKKIILTNNRSENIQDVIKTAIDMAVKYIDKI